MITTSDVEREVRKIVAQDPNLVYESIDGFCLNVVKDEYGNYVGSCLLGRALLAAGVSVNALADYTLLDIAHVAAYLGVQGPVEWLARVQYLHDRGWQARDAVRDADVLLFGASA